MEVMIILAILGIASLVAGVISENWTVALIGFLGLVLLRVLAELIATQSHQEPVVIKKSSDSDWEIHEGEPKIYQDTTITQVVVTLAGDTCYPTTEYKVLWRDSK